MSGQENVRALIDRYAKAWSSGNPDEVAACFAPRGRLVFNTGPPPAGRGGIADVVGEIMAAYPRIDITVGSLHEEEGRWYHEWQMESRHGTTGQIVSLTGSEMVTVSPDHLLQEVETTLDIRELNRQITSPK